MNEIWVVSPGTMWIKDRFRRVSEAPKTEGFLPRSTREKVRLSAIIGVHEDHFFCDPFPFVGRGEFIFYPHESLRLGMTRKRLAIAFVADNRLHIKGAQATHNLEVAREFAKQGHPVDGYHR